MTNNYDKDQNICVVANSNIFIWRTQTCMHSRKYSKSLGLQIELSASGFSNNWLTNITWYIVDKKLFSKSSFVQYCGECFQLVHVCCISDNILNVCLLKLVLHKRCALFSSALLVENTIQMFRQSPDSMIA